MIEGSHPHDAPTIVKSTGSGPTLLTGALERGQRINDRYEIEDLIGSGGFGQVYRARDQLLGRLVAFKMLTPAGGSQQESLIDEAKTVAKLDHPHIVPVYDVGLAGSIPWMAMKLIDGVSLDRLLLDAGNLPRDRALRITAQAASALDHAHRRAIVHRDIKPSNILISAGEDGTDYVWLADFGIAKMLTGDTSTGEHLVAGTPAYMAPEQITGKRVDARTDIFSLGCVAAEMITGKRCFSGGSYSDLVYRIVHDSPEGMAEVDTHAGEALGRTIRRALSKSPEDRFQTVHEFTRELLRSSEPETPTILQRLSRRRATVEWNGRDVLVTHDLRKSYRWRRPVLRGVDLRVERGSIYALLGRNGSGKTTLIRTLLGLYRRDGGEVWIFGRDPQRHAAAVMARVGFVADSLPVYDTLRVGDFLHLMRVSYPDWNDALAYEMLSRYRFPLDVRIKALSRGMRTQLALVGAMAHKPELLVLDDPTLGLDAVVLDDFFHTLAETARRDGTTVLIASHNIAEVETVATHVGLFDEGRIILSDSLEGLRTRTREVTLTFVDDVPEAIRAIPAFATLQSTGRRVRGVVLDQPDATMQRLHALNPSQVEVRELTLKEIFVNMMRQR